jgi:uncharacterized protein YwqG
MSGNARDLAACTVAELLELFASISLEIEIIDHVGRVNRLHETRRRVVAAIKDRTDGTIRAILPLLDHHDPHVRQSAAFYYGELDPNAYIRVLRELSLRKDKIGRDAAASLEWRQKHPFKGPVVAVKEPPSPRASRLSGHASPAGMSRADLEPLLFDAFPREIAKALIALARPSIRLSPQPLSRASIAGSRLGGLPVASKDWIWPTTGVWPKSGGLDWLNKSAEERGPLPEEPLWFLGQIDCADLVGFAPAGVLPRSGLLSFFGDSDIVTGCVGSLGHGGLYFFSSVESLEHAGAPVEGFEVLPSCGVGFAEAIDLPDPFSTAIQNLSLEKPLRDRYFDIRAAVSAHGIKAERYRALDHSKLFGWPDLIQDELDTFSSNSAVGDERLLLQLGSYDNGAESWGWGPGGLVYFAISDAALKQGELMQCCYEMQCT